MCRLKAFSDFIVALFFMVLYQTNTQAETHQLDTIYWQTYNSYKAAYISDEREIYAYDENGLITSSELSFWSTLQSKWYKSDKVIYHYKNDIVTDKIFGIYDINTSNWTDTLKYGYEYNDSRELTLFTVYEKADNFDVWLESSKDENLYDTSGNLVRCIFSTKYVLGGSWFLISKDSMVYDTNGDITEYIGQVYDEFVNAWVNYDHEIYNYSDEGKTVDYSYLIWNESSNTWDNYYKDNSTYTDDKTMWFFSYYWNETSGTWLDLTKEKHEFDTNGNTIYFAEYEYSESQGRYLYYDKEEYEYDNNNNLTVFIDYNAPTSFTWVESVKEVYNYDSSISISDVYHPYQDNIIGGVEVFNQLNFIEQQVWENSQWTASEKGVFVYDDVNTSTTIITNRKQHKVTVYPNPTTDGIYIEYNQVIPAYYNLFNIRGERVLSGETNRNYINLSQLPEGEYILKVCIDNDVITRSILKQ